MSTTIESGSPPENWIVPWGGPARRVSDAEFRAALAEGTEDFLLSKPKFEITSPDLIDPKLIGEVLADRFSRLQGVTMEAERVYKLPNTDYPDAPAGIFVLFDPLKVSEAARAAGRTEEAGWWNGYALGLADRKGLEDPNRRTLFGIPVKAGTLIEPAAEQTAE